MKVKPPFITYINAPHVLAALVLVKSWTFNNKHPKGKLALMPIYFECQQLTKINN